MKQQQCVQKDHTCNVDTINENNTKDCSDLKNKKICTFRWSFGATLQLSVCGFTQTLDIVSIIGINLSPFPYCVNLCSIRTGSVAVFFLDMYHDTICQDHKVNLTNSTAAILLGIALAILLQPCKDLPEESTNSGLTMGGIWARVPKVHLPTISHWMGQNLYYYHIITIFGGINIHQLYLNGYHKRVPFWPPCHMEDLPLLASQGKAQVFQGLPKWASLGHTNGNPREFDF